MCSVGVELLEYVQEQDGGTTETVSEAPGAYGGCSGSHAAGTASYETASTLAPWPSPEVGVAARHASGPSHTSLPPNLHPVVRPFVSSGRSAPGTGLQAGFGLHGCLRQGLGGPRSTGLAVSVVWTGPQLHWHISCLELLAVNLTLNRLKRRLRGEHVLVRMDNTATVAYINRQGGLRSHRMSQLARHLLLWSQKHLRSLHAIHIPGLLNRSRRAVTSCAPRRVETPSPEGPADLETFRTRTGRPVRVPKDFSLSVVLLPDQGNTRHGRAGTQLAPGPLRVCISPSEPSRTDTVQDQGGRGADPACGAILAHSDMVPRADVSRDSPSLADSSEEGSTDSEMGHLVAPASRTLET